MKLSFRDALIGATAGVVLCISFIAFTSWQLKRAHQEANEFCTAVRDGASLADVTAIAMANTHQRKVEADSTQVVAFFGSGCHCRIRFVEGKALPSVAICNS